MVVYIFFACVSCFTLVTMWSTRVDFYLSGSEDQVGASIPGNFGVQARTLLIQASTLFQAPTFLSLAR